MDEFKLPEINNKFNMTQEQYDELMKKLRILSFQQQEAQDTLEGGITSRNLASFRNTYVINAQDSLDASFPMYVHFNIISEMIKIVSVKVSFWILNYRAYDTAAKSGGGATSGATGTASGGGSTSGSGGGQTSSSGGAQSSSASSGLSYHALLGDEVNVVAHEGGYYLSAYMGYVNTVPWTHTHTVANHTHTVANHTHTTPNHTHPEHTHTTPAHTHDIAYGIYEETNSPKIKFCISENEGISYNDKFFGDYDTDKKDLEITSLLTGAGSKLIKFESTTRARLSVQIEIKLDIRAR